ncbi:MAG: flagellar export chaperone FliS [Rhodocyclaceae bacterium]|jgi:flagellar protein FliS|nr:flagellar export chaperone FliS [Rhodocyclaceae bacterium]
MFQTMRNPKSAYATVGIDMRVETASPHKLVLMLFDGAILAVAQAAAYAKNGDKKSMSESIMKASAIISQGLRDSLDATADADLVSRLSALYDYICVRLQFANIRGDAAIFAEVSKLLEELRAAWEEIANDPAVVSSNKSAA